MRKLKCKKSTKYLAERNILLTFAVTNRGVEQLVARQAHNLEVARSSRTSATKIARNASIQGRFSVSDMKEVGHQSDASGTNTCISVGKPAGIFPTKKMPSFGNNSSGAVIIDSTAQGRTAGRTANNVGGILGFTLPRLHSGKQWYVDFFAYDPAGDRMKRKKYMLDRIGGRSDRRRMATLLITRLTERLLQGWNPWVRDDSTRHMADFGFVLQQYRDYVAAMEKKGTLKQKTAYDYLSRLKGLELYMQECRAGVRYAYQFDRSFVVDFLDYLVMDKDVSARTRNNYRAWLSAFASWMVERRYCAQNPVEGIHQLREKEKLRDSMTKEDLSRMREYLYNKGNRHFLLACMMEYYTMIRPDELRHLHIEDISIKDREVKVAADIAKSRRERRIALNTKVLRLMLELRVFDAPSHYYLFGSDMKPGEEMIYLNAFRYEWGKMRKALHWPSSYQFYSLKDSGIRDLANAHGVVVARDQAGHTDVAVTNKYLKQGRMVPTEVKDFDGAL